MNTSTATPPTKPVAAAPKPEPPKPVVEKPKPKQVEVSAEIAAAVFKAHTSSTGYATTSGSEHATAFHGGVKVEMADPKTGRKTVTVKVPDTVSFELME